MVAIPLKLSFSDLALIDWLLEKPGQRFFTNASTIRTTKFNVYELSEKNADGKRTAVCLSNRFGGNEELLKRLGGKISFNSSKMYKSGFFNAYSGTFNNQEKFSALVATLVSNPFHWSDTIYVPTKTLWDWWVNSGRQMFEAERDKRETARAAVSRRLIIGCRMSIKPEIPDELKDAFSQLQTKLPNLEKSVVRPYALATVTKETATRVYIEDIEIIKPTRSRVEYDDVPIHGNAPNQYVELSSIMADRVSARGAAKLIEFEQEYADDFARISGEAMAKIIPIIRDLDLRQKQKEAERDDILRDLIESIEEPVPSDQSVPHRR